MELIDWPEVKQALCVLGGFLLVRTAVLFWAPWGVALATYAYARRRPVCAGC